LQRILYNCKDVKRKNGFFENFLRPISAQKTVAEIILDCLDGCNYPCTTNQPSITLKRFLFTIVPAGTILQETFQVNKLIERTNL
jgi:hypothetical protein